MQTKPKDRRWPHLRRFDYRSPGAYFVTICTFRRQPLWGKVSDGRVNLSREGEIADRTWCEIPRHFPHVRLDSYVVMPDHVHGLLLWDRSPAQQRVGTTHASSLHEIGYHPARPKSPAQGSFPAVVGSYKASVTRRVHSSLAKPSLRIWQSGYYDRVVRNEEELNFLREYITTNPYRWKQDDPVKIGRTS